MLSLRAVNIVFVSVVAVGHLAGQISGVIVDASGRPIPNVTVRAISSPTAIGPGPNSSPPLPASAQFSAVSDTSGRYSLANLPQGQYHLCAIDAGLHLDPCRWAGSPLILAKSAAAIQQIFASTLESGSSYE